MQQKLRNNSTSVIPPSDIPLTLNLEDVAPTATLGTVGQTFWSGIPITQPIQESTSPSRTQSYSANSGAAIRTPFINVALTASVAALYEQAAKETGNVVEIRVDHGCLAFIVGNDGEPVYLYEVVDAIDQCIDFDDIRVELPSLTFGQIAGAIAFLRRISQFNARQIDIDKLQDQWLEADPVFQQRIRTLLQQQENLRVLPAE